MATTRRRKSLALTVQLTSEAWRFDFFQAVRLLERSAALRRLQTARHPVSTVISIPGESVRFSSRPLLAFAAADIDRIVATDAADRPWQMVVNFMGLTGSQGVMPYYLSEIVLRELRNKNPALRDFLDLFNHRMVALYYRSWHKYRLPANFEHVRQLGLQRSHRNDLFTDALLSLAGLGSSELLHRLPIPDDAIAGFAGLLSRPICTADGLRGMIRQYFGIETSIRQFQGQWQPLSDDVQTRLPGPDAPQGLNNRVGHNALLGAWSYQVQNKFTVAMEELSYQQFMQIAPGSRQLEALKALIHFSVGGEQDFDLEVALSDREVPPAQLADRPDYQPLLGWNTHVSHPGTVGRKTLIRISQDIFAPDDSLPFSG